MPDRMLDHAGLKLLSELLDIPCPSGHEERLGGLIPWKIGETAVTIIGAEVAGMLSYL